jgi:hypothetical protein
MNDGHVDLFRLPFNYPAEGGCAMSETSEKTGFEFEMLKRYGAKWAVLAAMTAKMSQKGIEVPHSVFESLKNAKGKINSGCFSTCEVNCDLALAEGPLFSQGYLLEPDDFQAWSDLLAEAMQGKLDYERILGIPALEPVRNECNFLQCSCS